MASKRNVLTVAGALLLVLVMGVAPVSAEAGGPVLDYLQNTVKPLLDAIAARVVAIGTALAGVDGKVDAVADRVEDSGRVRTVYTMVTTNPGSLEVVNLDLLAADLGGWDKIRRYTVTIFWGGLAAAPPGMDAVRTITCVFDGSACFELNANTTDPSGRTGVVLDPYAGVNSLIRIQRGADGLGPIDVTINAYIEVEQ